MSKIDYDLKLIGGIVFDVDGVLSPSTIPMGADGVPQRMVNIKDGYALQLAVKKGLKIAIISGADSPALLRRFGALGIKDIFLKVSDKLPVLLKWLDDNALTPDRVAFVGDDIPDLQCLDAIGLSVVPRDGATELRQIARYVTQADGGYGVARELLEEVMRAQGLWMNRADAFGW